MIKEIPWYISFFMGVVVGMGIFIFALIFGPRENRWYVQGLNDGMKQAGYEKVDQREVWIRR